MSNEVQKIQTHEDGTYLFINSTDTIRVIESTLQKQGLNYRTVFGKNMTRFVLPDIKIQDGDSEMTGEIMFKNGLNCALTLFIGAYRLICANGLVIGQGVGGRVIHRVGPKAYNFVENVEQITEKTVVYLANDMQADIDYYQNEKVVNPLDVVLSLPIQNRVKESALHLLTDGHENENVKNVWGLYNFVNELTRRRSRSFDSSLNKDIGLLDHVALLASNQEKEAA